ncbi:MAG: NFACT family protein, partial [Acidaminococcaceae bacterium]|nr:NFACT family protein [Acidaminococcaceae bacterium]
MIRFGSDLSGIHIDYFKRYDENIDILIAKNSKKEVKVNGVKIKKGQASITLPNLYDGETLTIALNPSFTPAENAQQYYKRYNKYQRAQKELAKQISLTKDELEYLDSIETALSLPLKRNEIEE